MLSAVQLRGARHDEQRVAILLDLRPLMGVLGILDREVVQLELALQAAEQRRVRLVQANPYNMARLAAPVRGIVDRDVGDTSPIDVDAGRDHAIGVDGRGSCCNWRYEAHRFHPRRSSESAWRQIGCERLAPEWMPVNMSAHRVPARVPAFMSAPMPHRGRPSRILRLTEHLPADAVRSHARRRKESGT